MWWFLRSCTSQGNIYCLLSAAEAQAPTMQRWGGQVSVPQGAQNLVETHLCFHGFPSSVGFSSQINPADIPWRINNGGERKWQFTGHQLNAWSKTVLCINKIPFIPLCYIIKKTYLSSCTCKEAKRVEITFPLFYNQEVADSKSRLEISPVWDQNLGSPLLFLLLSP